MNFTGNLVMNSLFSGGFSLFALILAVSSFLIFFEYKGGLLSSSWKLLGLGLIFALLGYLGQIIFDIGPFVPSSTTRILVNLLFMIGYLLAGYGMLRFSEVPFEMQKKADALLLSLKATTVQASGEATKSPAGLSKKSPVKRILTKKSKLHI
jgi:hypothetical protein